jgi:hypothetical protein
MSTPQVRPPTLTFALLLLARPTLAQTAPQTPPPPTDPEAAAVLAELHPAAHHTTFLANLNAGLTLTSVHDSAAGWYTLLTPAIAYTFSPRYSVDLSMPVYLYRLAENPAAETQPPTPPGAPPRPAQPLVPQLLAHTFDPGDIFLSAHAAFSRARFTEMLTPSLTLPSGDSSDGLSTGRVTWDLSSHTSLWLPRAPAALLLDLGSGDSTSLFNRLVTRNYTSLGYLAHFQLGVLLWLPRRSVFQSVAYEQLPLGDSKIYTTLSRPGFPDQTVVSGRSVSEDNGFTNTLSIPIARRLALQGYYNRSLRLHTDTVGMGLSFTARSYEPRTNDLSYYDQLLKQ